MSRLRKTVVPFVWQPLTVAFTQGTAASVNLSAFLTNPYRYGITYTVAGSLPSGVTLSGGVVSYNGTGPGATAVVQFTANSGQYQATTDPVSVKIKETTVISTKPTWRVNTPATMGTFVRSVGGSFDLSLYSFDAEADPIRYYRSGAVGDTAPSSVLVNEITGIVTIPTGVTVGNYGVGVVLSDGQNFSDPRTFTLSIATTPPVWSANTPSSLGTFQQSNGGSYVLTSFASDPDGDALTFGRAGTAQDTAPSTVQVSASGVVSIPTNLPAATYTLVVRVSDGQGGTADRSFTFAVEAVNTGYAPNYPRTAACLIGSYNWNATVAQLASKFQITIVGHFPNASYGSYANVNAVGNAIKAYGTPVKLMVYTNIIEADDSWTPWVTKLNAEKGAGGNGDWWLRSAAGARVQTFAPYYRTNPTRFVTRDAQGYTWMEWACRWYNSSWGNGPWDGVFIDVVHTDGLEFNVIADWDENGSNDDDTTNYIEDALAQGWADAVNTWRSLRPTWWVVGEFLGVSRYAVHPTIDQLFNGGQQDFAIGNSWSVEEWGGWSLMMQWYRTALAAARSPKVSMLAIHDDYPQTSWPRYTVGGVTESNDQLSYRVLRYGLCSTLMDNGWFTYSTAENWVSTIYADEYDWNLGQPTQTPRTAPYSGGVYLREFDNGLAIVNPKGNGTRTITLPSAGGGKRWDRLSGTQAPAINTGATNVTSVTINERDGLILKRVNA